MKPPMTPMEFAESVLAPGLSLDQVHAIIRDDLDADLAAIQARHTDTPEATGDAVVLALPATPAVPAEEAA